MDATKAIYDAHLISGMSYLDLARAALNAHFGPGVSPLDLAKEALNDFFDDQSVDKAEMLSKLQDFSNDVDSLIHTIENEENGHTPPAERD